jgi:hypothetical protein
LARLDALEAIVLMASNEPEIDPAEAKGVRRLVMVRTARRRCNTRPTVWHE